MTALRVVLGDQLNLRIASLSDVNKAEDHILLCEVGEEATYVKHHKKKIAFLFSAMRHFAEQLVQDGFNVHYVKLDDRANTGSLVDEITRAVKIVDPSLVVVTEPSEYRVLQAIQALDLGVIIDIRQDDRFLCTHDEFAQWASGRKQLRMEYFYREMRKKHNILIDDGKPAGGDWNYDSENRKPPKEGLMVPETFFSTPDQVTRDVMALVADRFADHFGDLEPFHFAVTREQALHALEKFIEERLINFGDYQDAMVQGEPWMYHSHLSFYINCGLLLPLECVEAAELAYRAGQAPLNAVEGFIRQIIGWREYVRGIYWLKMPSYEQANFFDADRDLPALFWGAETKMNCLKQCVSETKENAYAHHIQRLMVLGNFALVAGLDPKQVNAWFMVVYADAYQWVELPNVTGMILFADGGLLGSKPYAASGAYINKMSNYCKGCHYKVSKKNGEQACPFNYLYWDFLIRNQNKLRGNHRLSMIYRTLERMSEEKVDSVKVDSLRFFDALEAKQIV